MNLQSQARYVAQTVISPRQFDFWSRTLGSIASSQRVFARVVRRDQESANTVTLTLKANRHFSAASPGQHIAVSAEIRGIRESRCYSLSKPSRHRQHLSITVRREVQGLMSNWLHDEAVVGTVLELSQAFGDLGTSAGQLDADQSQIYLAAGSGITAIANLLLSRAQALAPLKGCLLYWDKDASRFCFNTELEAIAKQHPDFKIHRICTGTPDSKGQTPSAQPSAVQTHQGSGRISSALLDTLAPALDGATVFACGGDGFIATARALLGRRAAGFHAESFSPQLARPEGGVASRSGADTESLHARAPRQVALTLRKSGRQLQISTEDRLLDALEAAGISVPFGCRSGICNTCSCQQLSGSSVNTANGINHNGNQAVRLCVSRATGPVELDL